MGGQVKLACVLAGTADFAVLDALKTHSSSPCTSVLQAAMMVPDLSTFVTTAQVVLSSSCVCHLPASHFCINVTALQ